MRCCLASTVKADIGRFPVEFEKATMNHHRLLVLFVLVGAATWLAADRRMIAADFSQAEHLRLVWMEIGELTVYAPWQILAYMTIAAATGIITGLLTKPVAKNKLDRFYGLVRTPVQQGEDIDRLCELPPGVAPDARRMITTAFGLEIPVPSRASVLGFVATWVAVAILIGGFVAFVWW